VRIWLGEVTQVGNDRFDVFCRQVCTKSFCRCVHLNQSERPGRFNRLIQDVANDTRLIPRCARYLTEPEPTLVGLARLRSDVCNNNGLSHGTNSFIKFDPFRDFYRDSGYPQVVTTPSRTELADRIRRHTAAWTIRRNGGYLAQACGSAEILATMLTRLDLGTSIAPVTPPKFRAVPTATEPGPRGEDWLGNGPDVFVLSPAHYATAMYAALVGLGRLDERALVEDSHDGGLLEMIGGEHSPGLPMSAGSLGNAFPVAVGRAIARTRAQQPGSIWVMLSDGEMQEGSTWETAQLAAAQQLNNINVIIDRNAMQVDGHMVDVMPITEPEKRFAAFGWHTHVIDGHDFDALDSAMDACHREAGPSVIVCRTQPWRGFTFLKQRWDDKRLHFIRLTEVERESLQLELA
jgi:transketolase